ADVILPIVRKCVHIALRPGGGVAREEVRHTQTRCRAIESKQASGVDPRCVVEQTMQIAYAEAHLMVTPDPAEIVVDTRVGAAHIVIDNRVPASDTETIPARYRKPRLGVETG